MTGDAPGSGGSGGVCLVYLAWTPYGIERAEQFLAAYQRHPAGTPHRLVVALAGSGPDRGLWRDLFAATECSFVELGEGMDLDHYRATVELVEAERFCFLNTVSEVLAPDWLAHLDRALSEPGVGMVGTTGSLESPNAVRPGPLRKLRPGHDPFPNPHLRTNGFMLERGLLRELRWPTGLDKLGAVALEGGTGGLTRQVRDRGLGVRVVGRDGVAYPPGRWRQSHTFRSGGQANLLVADNRTRHYASAGPLTRRGLAWLAWHRWD